MGPAPQRAASKIILKIKAKPHTNLFTIESDEHRILNKIKFLPGPQSHVAPNLDGVGVDGIAPCVEV
ncbi:unnamed protein product [Hermetia illucens]|uniref:Uncharacterized protein n=1 Tax=Hermetia illucens TaxID=343691 RepID=A0A7R8V3E5_HERIL|nr:unnamed protein product [Hermetia illucens]